MGTRRRTKAGPKLIIRGDTYILIIRGDTYPRRNLEQQRLYVGMDEASSLLISIKRPEALLIIISSGPSDQSDG
ncbi:hypothetical protein A2U01_0042906 [Trifolium medium]|uniref:Uncharacterized protein n=1 Tax=Trifolium medium TaxID=97028 RepID=A0A392QE00_9FABA|nr:hypothetical protein [Trifolium medium]